MPGTIIPASVFLNRKAGFLYILPLLLCSAVPLWGEVPASSADTMFDVTAESDSAGSDDINPEVNFSNFVTREEMEASQSALSWKKGDFTVTPYGFLWVNMAMNSCACASDSFCLYNYSAETNDKASSAIDARTSRLGVKVAGPNVADSGWKMGGTVEIDFQGTVNVTRNKGGLQLRKAFIEVVNKANESKIEFGQDWDTISPLAPQMLNYLPAGFAGNIGYRRTQIRYEKGRTWSPDLKTVWTIGLADSFPNDFTSLSSVSANSGSWPLIEGRYGVSFGEQARNGLPITVGVSGHVGENTYIFSPIAHSFLENTPRQTEYLKTWSLNVDADLPISHRLRLQGEYFLGENLSGFCGAINQGVDLYQRSSVRSQGGWLALQTKVTDKLTNNTGAAVDKPFSDDLIGTTAADANGNTSARTKNSLIFSNFLYQWNKALMTGVEFGYWKTEYRKANVSGSTPVFSDMKPGENFRVDIAAQYLF